MFVDYPSFLPQKQFDHRVEFRAQLLDVDGTAVGG
jgi:hypothetical protein